jgi:hypothetical protein
MNPMEYLVHALLHEGRIREPKSGSVLRACLRLSAPYMALQYIERRPTQESSECFTSQLSVRVSRSRMTVNQVLQGLGIAQTS